MPKNNPACLPLTGKRAASNGGDRGDREESCEGGGQGRSPGGEEGPANALQAHGPAVHPGGRYACTSTLQLNNAEYIAVMALLGLIHEACTAIPEDKLNPNNMYICILYRCAKPSRPQVDSMLALAAEKEKSEQLEARVNILEQEVRNTCSCGGGGGMQRSPVIIGG